MQELLQLWRCLWVWVICKLSVKCHLIVYKICLALTLIAKSKQMNSQMSP